MINEGKYLSGDYGFDEVISDIQGKTLIFFDTETTGINPNIKYVQVTEIAGVAYDPTGKQLDSFHKKSTLNPDTKKAQDYEDKTGEPISGKGKTISDINKMTGYDDENAGERMSEKDMLLAFKSWVEGFTNPILVAQNTEFDMKQVATKIGKINVDTTLDTLQFARIFMTPIMDTLKDNPEIQKTRELMTVTRTNKWGRSYKELSHTLDILGKVFDVKTDMWHSAIADTQQLAGIFFAMLSWYKKHEDEVKSKPEDYDKYKRSTLANYRNKQIWMNKMKKQDKKSVKSINKKFDTLKSSVESMNNSILNKKSLTESIKFKFLQNESVIKEMPLRMNQVDRPLVADWSPSKWMREVQWVDMLGSYKDINVALGKGMMGMQALGIIDETGSSIICMAKCFQKTITGDEGPEAKVFKFIEIATAPEYRGQGLARKLHEFCIHRDGGVASDNSLFETKPGANDGMVGMWTKQLPAAYPCYVCRDNGSIIAKWEGGELDDSEETILVALKHEASFSPEMQELRQLPEEEITEMPHVEAPNKNGMFDLGLEEVPKTPEALFDYMSRIFSGEEIASRYNKDKEITIKLDTDEKKKRFWEDLTNDMVFPLYIKRYFNVTIDELANELGIK